jgi:hypothetical protein
MMSSYTYTKQILRIQISRYQHETWYEGRHECLISYSVESLNVFDLVPEILRLKVEYSAYCQDPNIEISM